MDWQDIYMNMNIKPTILMYSLAKMLNRKVYSDDQFSKSIQCGAFLTHYDGNIKKDFLEEMV